MSRPLLFSVLICLASVVPAWGQTVNSGMFGNRNIGSAVTPRSSSAFGARPGMGAGTGVGGLGNVLGVGMGSGGTISGATMQANAAAGQITGNERYLRGNRQGQFVGSDSADLTANNMLSALGRGLAGGLNIRPSQQSNGNSGSNTASVTKVRRTNTVGFAYAPPPTTVTVERVQAIIEKRIALPRPESVQIEIQGRTAILRGTVATDHDRDLLSRLIALEAGISEVQNELIVAPPESASQPGELPQASEPPSLDPILGPASR